jgi:hypothetical protein
MGEETGSREFPLACREAYKVEVSSYRHVGRRCRLSIGDAMFGNDDTDLADHQPIVSCYHQQSCVTGMEFRGLGAQAQGDGQAIRIDD